MNVRDQIISHISKKFNVAPEYLWVKTPNTAVFRHNTNYKWFAIIMNVPYRTIGINRDGSTDIMNVKCDNALIGCLLPTAGYRPAYHMNKEHWISIILDGTVPITEIQGLIKLSYNATK